MEKNISLPDDLQNFKEVFEKTRKSFLRIINKQGESVEIWQSKFAGMPYLPYGVEYPKDSEGKYLYLAAQINFEEIPPLAYLPKKGILQFYIADNDLYGLDFDNQASQKDFRVLFFPEIDKESFQRDLPELPEPEFTPFDEFFKAQKLEFIVKEEYAGISDANLEYVMGEKLEEFEKVIEKDNYKLADWISEHISNAGHKIGGYADFVQEDPRKYDEEKLKKYNTLLLQIDTSNGICWGDMGVANFFIDAEKLKNSDFSDVMYNWDCG
ncbi:MAG: YwqG family protein [Thermonemataceae bacterium]|nr:YwqG family protein [Thermonemataceae bacterium]